MFGNFYKKMFQCLDFSKQINMLINLIYENVQKE